MRPVFSQRVKSILSQIGYALSVTLLVVSLALVGLAFVFAARDQIIPAKWWDSEGGNHGPWRYYQPGRALLSFASMILLSALITSCITGGFFGRPKHVFIVMLAALLCLVLDFIFLFWLVD